MKPGWNWANCSFAEGKYEPALQNYDHARQLQPDDPRTYFEMGRTLSLLQRPAESIESFRRAIQLQPGYWEAHYYLGGELALQGDIPAAAKANLKPPFNCNPAMRRRI